MTVWRELAMGCGLCGLSVSSVANANERLTDRSITKSDITDAQKAWCPALVGISKAYEAGGHAVAKVLA